MKAGGATRNWRLIGAEVVICLPTLLLIGGWAYYLIAEMPTRIRAQQSRIGREYRRLAEEAIRNPGRTQVLVERPKGWRKISEIDGRSWGRGRNGRRCYVWYQSGEREWRCQDVEEPEAFPYELAFYWGGGAVATVLLLLSALAVWFLDRFMKDRDDFLAATAHDLTTPLVGMRRTIGRNDAEAKNLNERMIRLVANIKDFLKLGGRPAPKAEAFDLVKAYAEAYALFAADYRDLFRDDDVRVDCSRLEGEAIVFADETMTVQILWNLLGNDLKYAAPFGRVSVRFLREGEFVKAEFIDEGPGMSPRQMRKAFDRYYRAQTVLESGKGGFGIGLCTAKDFARAMGGDLTVRANAPKGCVFALTLPAVPFRRIRPTGT